MHHASPLCESQQLGAELSPNGWARQSPTFCESPDHPSSTSYYPMVVDPSFQRFEFKCFDNSSDRHGRSSFSFSAIQLFFVSFQFDKAGQVFVVPDSLEVPPGLFLMCRWPRCSFEGASTATVAHGATEPGIAALSSWRGSLDSILEDGADAPFTFSILYAMKPDASLPLARRSV